MKLFGTRYISSRCCGVPTALFLCPVGRQGGSVRFTRRGLWQSCLQWSLWSAPGCGDRQQQYPRGVPISIDVDQPTLMRRTGARRVLSPVCRIEKGNGLPACEYLASPVEVSSGLFCCITSASHLESNLVDALHPTSLACALDSHSR